MRVNVTKPMARANNLGEIDETTKYTFLEWADSDKKYAVIGLVQGGDNRWLVNTENGLGYLIAFDDLRDGLFSVCNIPEPDQWVQLYWLDVEETKPEVTQDPWTSLEDARDNMGDAGHIMWVNLTNGETRHEY